MTKAEILEAKLREEFKKKMTSGISFLYRYQIADNITGMLPAYAELWHNKIRISTLASIYTFSVESFINRYYNVEVYSITQGDEII